MEFLRSALDGIGLTANFPPYGAVDQMHKVVDEVLKNVVGAGDGKPIEEEEFKKLMEEILASVMLQLEGNPIAVSANSVVHEPVSAPASILSLSSEASAFSETELTKY